MIAHAGTLTNTCTCNGVFHINGECVVCRKSRQVTRVCQCESGLFVNERCSACGGLLTDKNFVNNNTVASEEESFDRLRRKLQRNVQEFRALVAQLETMSGQKMGRKSRGLFTKKILDKVEQRFPSGGQYRKKPRKHRRQRR